MSSYKTTEITIAGLKALEAEANCISGEWNGDDSGNQEDRAHASEELIEKISEVISIIEELDL